MGIKRNSKSRKRDRMKDLEPKGTRAVKGGNKALIVKEWDASTPMLVR